METFALPYHLFQFDGILLSLHLSLQVWPPSNPAPLQGYMFFQCGEAFALHSESSDCSDFLKTENLVLSSDCTQESMAFMQEYVSGISYWKSCQRRI